MKMESSRFFTVTLLVIFTLNTFLLPAESASCCLSYTKKKIHCIRMKSYTIQTYMGVCDLDAIIFHSKAGHSICADPAKAQTQRTMHCLKARGRSLV
ncbi:hypothetical protein GJAV_G00083680 [Gymnothorax javanicus]|nr:hypothetical protein GJAV_G00083680 [Gymnothorax javanicus]